MIDRRTFLKTACGTAGLLYGCSSLRIATDPHAIDDELLAQARQHIEDHRKGDGVIVVRGPDGRAIQGAAVKAEQLQHDFLFGCNLFMFGRLKDPGHEEEYRRRFAALLNYATLGFYWGSYERERGKPMYDYTDRVVQWCAEHDIRCKGHPLVWDYLPDPNWLPQGFAQIRALSTGRVREIVSRYKGRIDTWDVVNEPTDLGRTKTRMSEWAMSLGAVPYLADHLKVARAANPGATLLINDYRTDLSYYRILDGLREDGNLLFDAIGIQSHMHHDLWSLPQLGEVCDRYRRLGLPIHFTEATVVSGSRHGDGQWEPSTPELEAEQAAYVSKFYTLLFGHPAVQALTWWDFSDRGAWQSAAAGFLRPDMSPKPIYEHLMALIRGEWWTKTGGTTDARGEYVLRAFYGRHRITVRLPNGTTLSQEVDWKQGQPNRFELRSA